MISTNFVDKLWIPLIMWTRCSASSAVNVHFFGGIQKSFPRTTTTNKSFIRPRQRSLAVKKVLFWYRKTLERWKIKLFYFVQLLLLNGCLITFSQGNFYKIKHYQIDNVIIVTVLTKHWQSTGLDFKTSRTEHTFYNSSQKHESTLLHMHVMNVLNDSRPSMYKKISLKIFF